MAIKNFPGIKVSDVNSVSQAMEFQLSMIRDCLANAIVNMVGVTSPPPKVEKEGTMIPNETDSTLDYSLYLSSNGTVIYKRVGAYSDPYEFRDKDIVRVSPLLISEKNKISPYVVYNDEIYTITGDINDTRTYLRNIESENIVYVHYKDVNEIKFLKDINMLHIKPEEVKDKLTKEAQQKERKNKTLVNLSVTLILSILIILQHQPFILIGGYLFLGYIILTHICECNYKLNVKIEVMAGVLNFVLFNLATILIGSVLAVINVLHPTVTWKEFFEYTVLVPTLTSIVVAVTAPIYMTIKRGIYLLCVQVSKFVNKLFAI